MTEIHKILERIGISPDEELLFEPISSHAACWEGFGDVETVSDYYEAIQLNRVVCMTYKGYLKTILDDGIREEQIEGRVREFISDVDMIVMKLAKDLKGYNGYYSTKKNI